MKTFFSQKAYQEVQKERMKRGCWFAIPRRDVEVLGLETATFLGYLLNTMQAPGRADEEGWCVLTLNYLCRGLYTDAEKILELCDNLIDLGILQRKGDRMRIIVDALIQ